MSMTKVYPEDVDLVLASLIEELNSIPYTYFKAAHSDKNGLSFLDLYRTIFKDKIQLAFPKVESFCGF